MSEAARRIPESDAPDIVRRLLVRPLWNERGSRVSLVVNHDPTPETPARTPGALAALAPVEAVPALSAVSDADELDAVSPLDPIAPEHDGGDGEDDEEFERMRTELLLVKAVLRAERAQSAALRARLREAGEDTEAGSPAPGSDTPGPAF